MFLEERVQRKITYLWFSWESWCLCICITCGCRFITNKAFKQKNVSFQNLIRKKRVIYFNLVYLYGSWSQQSNYETLCSRKHVLTLSKNNNNIKKIKIQMGSAVAILAPTPCSRFLKWDIQILLPLSVDYSILHLKCLATQA